MSGLFYLFKKTFGQHSIIVSKVHYTKRMTNFWDCKTNFHVYQAVLSVVDCYHEFVHKTRGIQKHTGNGFKIGIKFCEVDFRIVHDFSGNQGTIKGLSKIPLLCYVWRDFLEIYLEVNHKSIMMVLGRENVPLKTSLHSVLAHKFDNLAGMLP